MTITLPFPPSVNAMYANQNYVGRKGRKKSDKYKDWLKAAGWTLNAQRPQKTTGNVSLTILYGENHRKYGRDLSNHVKAIEDLLVKHQVIEDDRFVDGLVLAWSDEVQDVEVRIFGKAQPDISTQGPAGAAIR